MGHKRKILMVTMGLEIGGAETHIVELSKELARRGDEIVVVSNGGVYEKELNEAGIRTLHAPLHRRAAGPMLSSLAALRKIIKAEKPDVVHAHARIPGFLCGILQKSMKFPFVTTAHWVFDTSGPLKSLTNWGQRTIAVSEDIKTYLWDNYRVPPEHVTVTINGIDTDKFSPEVSGDEVRAELGIPAGALCISSVSRLDESRAFAARCLIDVAPALAEAYPGLHILIAGAGDVYEELAAKARAVNEAAGYQLLHLPGARTDINRVVAAGDIFVGVSRAALEAMAGGKPVVIAGNEGYHGIFGPEKCEEARAGNFCCRGLPMCSDQALLKDLKTLLDAPAEELLKQASYNRQVIFDYYSVARMAQDAQSVYDEVLSLDSPSAAATSDDSISKAAASAATDSAAAASTDMAAAAAGSRTKSKGGRAKKVVIAGYYGFDNLGDDAILQSVKRRVDSFDKPVSLIALSKNPQATKRDFGIDAVERFNPAAVIMALKGADLLIFGGGSLLQDSTSVRSLFYYVNIINLAKKMRVPVMLYANGIGPISSQTGRKLVKKALDGVELITLRDSDSQGELVKMGVKSDNIHVTADPIFAAKGSDRESVRKLFEARGIALDRPIFAVSLRQAEGIEEKLDELAALCDRISETYTILFMIMQTPADAIITEKVRELMKADSYVFDAPGKPDDMIGATGLCDVVMSMRLHTLIFAASAGVPAMGLVYDPKVSAYLELLGQPSCGSPETFNADSSYEAFRTIVDNKEFYEKLLHERAAYLKDLAAETDLYLARVLGMSPEATEREEVAAK